MSTDIEAKGIMTQTGEVAASSTSLKNLLYTAALLAACNNKDGKPVDTAYTDTAADTDTDTDTDTDVDTDTDTDTDTTYPTTVPDCSAPVPSLSVDSLQAVAFPELAVAGWSDHDGITLDETNRPFTDQANVSVSVRDGDAIDAWSAFAVPSAADGSAGALGLRVDPATNYCLDQNLTCHVIGFDGSPNEADLLAKIEEAKALPIENAADLLDEAGVTAAAIPPLVMGSLADSNQYVWVVTDVLEETAIVVCQPVAQIPQV